MPIREIDLGWAFFNEILALARMKSATQMKSSATPQMKLNPPIAAAISSDQREDFIVADDLSHPRGWI